MSETAERPQPLCVQAGDLRVGDVLNSSTLYRDEDDSQGAVCEAVEHQGVLVTITWRITETGEKFTWTRTTMTPMLLSRRGPSVSARELLWDELGLDMHPNLSREKFAACMDVYDRAASAGSGEELA